METPNHTRFDRHAIFNQFDRRIVMMAIDDAEDANDRELENMLFGLFDGYLYNELREKAEQNVQTDTLIKLKTLFDKIASHESEE